MIATIEIPFASPDEPGAAATIRASQSPNRNTVCISSNCHRDKAR